MDGSPPRLRGDFVDAVSVSSSSPLLSKGNGSFRKDSAAGGDEQRRKFSGRRNEVTYASFSGLSTQLVRGNANATVFASKNDDPWPRKAIKQGIKKVRLADAAVDLQASSMQPSPTGLFGGMQGTADAGTSAFDPSPDSPQHIRVTLPAGATSTGQASNLRWTGADVSGLDWRHFVIPPPEPPPPPPPLALKERLLEIYKLDDSAEQSPRKQAKARAEEDDWEAANIAAKEKQMYGDRIKDIKTLRERISDCSTHNVPKVTDDTWVRLMLQRHRGINKKTGKYLNLGEDEADKESTEPSRSASSDTGVSIRAGEMSWEMADAKSLAEEKDRLSRLLREKTMLFEEAKEVDEQQIHSLRGKIKKLRAALNLPDSEDEDYDDLLAKRKVVPGSDADGDEYEEEEGEEEEEEEPIFTPEEPNLNITNLLSTVTSGSREQGEYIIVGERVPQGTEADILWAERQLGFMGVHRGNVLAKKHVVEEHVNMLWKEGMRKDANEASSAMDILLAHARREGQGYEEVEDFAWAERIMRPVGVSWYEVDVKGPVIQQAIAKLSAAGGNDDVRNLKKAANAFKRRLETEIRQALRALSEISVDQTNFLAQRARIGKKAEQLTKRGDQKSARQVIDAYATLRRRRRALLQHAHAALALEGVSKATIPDLKIKKARALIAAIRRSHDGSADRAERMRGMEQVVNNLVLQRDDASRWAGQVLKQHQLDPAKEGSNHKLKELVSSLPSRQTRAELKLAWAVVELPAEGRDERLLDSDDGIGEEEEESHARRTVSVVDPPSDHSSVGSVNSLMKTLKSAQSQTKIGPNGQVTYYDKNGQPIDLEKYAREHNISIDAARRKQKIAAPHRASDAGTGRPGKQGGWKPHEAPPGYGLGGDDDDNDETALGEGEAAYAPHAFVGLVEEELFKLEEEQVDGAEMTPADMAKEARRRAKRRARSGSLSRRIQVLKLQDDLRAERGDPPVTLLVRPFEDGGIAPMKDAWSRRNLVRAEARRMLASGDWKPATDNTTGKPYFVNGATGEVVFSLEKAAKRRLADKRLIASDSSDAGSDDGDQDDSDQRAPVSRGKAKPPGGGPPSASSSEFDFTHVIRHDLLRLGRRASDAGTEDSGPGDDPRTALRTAAAQNSPVAVESKKAQHHRALRVRLINFLHRNDPARIDQVDELLAAWAGQEEAMFESLKQHLGHARPHASAAAPHESAAAAREAEARRAEEKRTLVQGVISNCKSGEEFRRLLIKLLAAASPSDLPAVSKEVQLYGGQPQGRLTELVEAVYGYDAAFTGWHADCRGIESLSGIPAARTASKELDQALRKVAIGTVGHLGVLPEQLSPAFRIHAPGGAEAAQGGGRAKGYGEEEHPPYSEQSTPSAGAPAAALLAKAPSSSRAAASPTAREASQELVQASESYHRSLSRQLDLSLHRRATAGKGQALAAAASAGAPATPPLEPSYSATLSLLSGTRVGTAGRYVPAQGPRLARTHTANGAETPPLARGLQVRPAPAYSSKRGGGPETPPLPNSTPPLPAQGVPAARKAAAYSSKRGGGPETPPLPHSPPPPPPQPAQGVPAARKAAGGPETPPLAPEAQAPPPQAPAQPAEVLRPAGPPHARPKTVAWLPGANAAAAPGGAAAGVRPTDPRPQAQPRPAVSRAYAADPPGGHGQGSGFVPEQRQYGAAAGQRPSVQHYQTALQQARSKAMAEQQEQVDEVRIRPVGVRPRAISTVLRERSVSPEKERAFAEPLGFTAESSVVRRR
ncbi:hypothetical protein DIPPA_13204 [Diplonema papillatum]|nr:hypothetical protein DIPPA_13204 [Diplonema papillatum]